MYTREILGPYIVRYNPKTVTKDDLTSIMKIVDLQFPHSCHVEVEFNEGYCGFDVLLCDNIDYCFEKLRVDAVTLELLH